MTQQAIIRAQDCIGCTKCIDACPTDAIIGATKLLHSVLEQDCIGCERCVPMCPVDCIELHPMAAQYDTEYLQDEAKTARVAYIRHLAQAHKQRLQHEAEHERILFEAAKNESAARKEFLQKLFSKKS